MAKEKITIKDVARAAGVSTQTVSRVLNNRSDVSADTRLHVQEIIDTLGYSPNMFARSLSRGRSSTIGVIAYGLDYFGTSNVLSGIEGKINELGFSLTLSLVDGFDPARVQCIINDLVSRRVEGIIWAVPAIIQYLDWLTEKFSQIYIPVVYINKSHNGSDYVSSLDNELGGRLAAQHLMEQGYRRIGIISGPKGWWEAQQRLAGWREAVTLAGYSNIDDLIVEGDWNAPSGDAGLHSLLEQDAAVDAVFISNDQMALGALQAARRLGLNIPGDLGIVGFDDIPEAAYFFPPLTTVRQDARELGAMSVDQMNIVIQAHQKKEVIEPHIAWLKPQLIVRQSAARGMNTCG